MDRERILNFWASVKFKDHDSAAMHEHMAQRALAYRTNFYDPVEKATGIPWYLVAAFDMREEDFDHNGYLGNGDKLWRVTTHIPRGRGPFENWFDGAIDALKLDHVSPAFGEGNHWDIVTVLIAAEKFNGLGYFHHNLPSPYVWSGTSVQHAGKYTSDGHWDPNAWDHQPGVAGLLLALKLNHGIDLNEA